MKTAPLLALGIFCIVAGPLAAQIEVTQTRKVAWDVTPLDVVTTSDGQTILVLGPGVVEVYSLSESRVTQKIPVSSTADKLAWSEATHSLLVTSSGDKTLEILKLQTVYHFDFSGLPFRGPGEAAVTLTVFSDYQCPYCQKLFPIIDQILEKYPDQLKLVIKNFPLQNHPYALKAAEAAQAAFRQGKFWPFHDQLLAQMATLDDASVLSTAQALGLDMARFRRDWADASVKATIVRDVAEGNDARVRGTPTVFLNGKLVEDQTADGLTAAIEAALSKEKPGG